MVEERRRRGKGEGDRRLEGSKRDTGSKIRENKRNKRKSRPIKSTGEKERVVDIYGRVMGGETRRRVDLGNRCLKRADSRTPNVCYNRQFPVPNKDHAGDDRPAISLISSTGCFIWRAYGKEAAGGRRTRKGGWVDEKRKRRPLDV